MDKKGGSAYGVIFLVIALFSLLFIGFIIAIGSMTINWMLDETIPELKSIGSIQEGNNTIANMTRVTELAIDPANNFVQSFTWLGGLLYIIGLFLCIALAFAFRFSGHKWLIAFFILLMLILVIVSIFISNAYEEYYNDTGEVGTRLKEQGLLSFLILYSPMIFCIIGFVCGIIMFTGSPQENFV